MSQGRRKKAHSIEKRRERPGLQRAGLQEEQCVDEVYTFVVVRYREPQRTRVETQTEREQLAQ